MSAPQSSGYVTSTANGVYCAYCGSTPAARVDIRGHRGFVIFMQLLKSPGPFCRDCGLATYRKMTVESMWIGWWGFLSAVINPVTLLINLGPRSTLTKLPPPIPGGPRIPMQPGKPLFHRVEFLLAVALILGGPIILLALASLS
ncbi:hypothetical protein ACFWFQ_02155 [Nocardia salmonicida]|uniref:hypothetical protein n=1 Tax=Nocardia salmonicida TaxID=53431 RepID=UPI003646CE40